MQNRIVRLKDLVQILGLSKATIWRRIKFESDFPPLIKLGNGPNSAIGFLQSDVDKWIEKKASKRSQQYRK